MIHLTTFGARSIVWVAALSAVACSSPTSPGRQPRNAVAPAPGGSLAPKAIEVTISDGWTKTPVPDARVTADGLDTRTDASGRVALYVDPSMCVPIDIQAAGFLPRRTCVKSSITLWPVAGDAESEATRSAAFIGARMIDGSGWASYAGFMLRPELRDDTEVVAVWAAAADEIKTVTNGRLAIPMLQELRGGEGYIISVTDTTPRCSDTWFQWTFAAAGFCWEGTVDYFVSDVVVRRDLIARREVALRALLYGYTLKPHNFPGLLNSTAPDTELSPFERKTLHMMSLRWPATVAWPDSDRLR